jgi:hypothetical protein
MASSAPPIFPQSDGRGLGSTRAFARLIRSSMAYQRCVGSNGFGVAPTGDRSRAFAGAISLPQKRHRIAAS